MENFSWWGSTAEGLQGSRGSKARSWLREKEAVSWLRLLSGSEKQAHTKAPGTPPEMLAQGWRDIGMAWGDWGLEKTSGLQAGEFGGWDTRGWDLGCRNEEGIRLVRWQTYGQPVESLACGQHLLSFPYLIF